MAITYDIKVDMPITDVEVARIWDLCKELNDLIEKAVKSGYRIDVSTNLSYKKLGWKNEFTVISADIYRDFIPARK